MVSHDYFPSLCFIDRRNTLPGTISKDQRESDISDSLWEDMTVQGMAISAACKVSFLPCKSDHLSAVMLNVLFAGQ